MTYDLFPMLALVGLLPAIAFVPATFFAHMALLDNTETEHHSVFVQAHPMYFLAKRAEKPTCVRWLMLWQVIACCPVLNLVLVPAFIGLYFHQALSRKMMKVCTFLDSILPSFV